MATIQNGSSILLNANSGTLPNVYDAILDYFQPMTFTSIVRTVEAFQAVETPTSVTFRGVIQPAGKPLELSPEGQRAWSNWNLWSDISLKLEVDDVVTYLTKQYRVMATNDWSTSGYMQYVLKSDWDRVPQ